MASSINFGSVNIDPETNRIRLMGSNSGIDTEAMVNALVDAKKIPALRIETRITEREAQQTAYGQLETLLQDVRSSLEGLRSPPGSLGTESNLFERKAAYFSSNTTTQPGELIGVSVTNSAAPGTFSLRVDQLATARKATTDSTSAADQSLADAFNGGGAFTGGFTLGLQGGSTAEITVDSNGDIYDLRDAINAENATTGVTASVLKVSDTDYRLVVTGDETGRDVIIGEDAGTSGGRELIGLWDGAGNTFKNSLQASGQAVIAVDGITVTRNDNTIDDLFDGVTIDLLNAEPGTTLTIDIEQQLGDAKTAVLDFVDSYNSVRDFIDQQRQVGDDGTVDKLTSPLFADGLLRQVSQDLSREVTANVAGLPTGALSMLSDVGIIMGEGGKLVVDEGKLDDALLNNGAEVRSLFEFQSTISSSNLRFFERNNTLSGASFDVVVTDADNDGVPESATINGEATLIDGQKITAADGTTYDGVSFLWVGTGNETISVSASQGIADRVFNLVDNVLDPTSGRIATIKDSLTEQIQDYRDDIAAIEERAEAYRETLITRFAALETALSQAESMMNYIRANTEAATADQ